LQVKCPDFSHGKYVPHNTSALAEPRTYKRVGTGSKKTKCFQFSTALSILGITDFRGHADPKAFQFL
jgi:hypothetical protein